MLLIFSAIGPSSPQCHAQSVLALLHTIEVVEIEMPIVPGFEWRQQSNIPGEGQPHDPGGDRMRPAPTQEACLGYS